MEKLAESGNARRWTPLMYAVYLGHTASVQQLLKAGAELEQRNASGQTALILAATCSLLEIVSCV